MTPDRWRQIDDLYHRALERPPEARAAFLAAMCAGDEELKRRLESLLAKDASGGRILDQPAAELLSELAINDSGTRLAGGSQLGPYRIERILGEGGMGRVYKAYDSRLGRWVAIKVSRDRFDGRFEQEARAVAALNHPHVCTLYDIGPDYLVMELVEGETLAERIARGPLSIEDALAIAQQIAAAMEYSHDKGIIHRDLKPGNVKITPAGSLKVLDFGLAKRATEALAAITAASTLTNRETQPGVILGTAAYMAPEQARGQTIDKRVDIWAFGTVLYEMLSGRRPFQGDTLTDTLAAVLNAEPDWTRIPAKAQRLLRACMEKDPRQRLRDIGDARRLLDDTLPVATPSHSKWLGWIAGIALASALAGWAITWRSAREPKVETPVARFTIPPPANTVYRTGAISPDGRWFAFIAVDSEGESRLWVRRLDSLVAESVAPAEHWPFWSPDSHFIAFKHDGKLRKVEPSGGTPQTICDARLLIGGSWNREETIIFSSSEGIVRVSAKGGAVSRVTTLNASRGETAQNYPVFLPDGRHFLYVIQSENRANGGIYLGSLDAPASRIRLLEDISNAQYVAASQADPDTGYLLFARGQALMAQRFNARSYLLQGEAVSVAQNIMRSSSNLSASFSASDNGLLVTGPTYFGEQLTWFDRSGKQTGAIGNVGLHLNPRLSPDDQTVVDDWYDGETFSPNIWLLPVTGGRSSRFTFIPSDRPYWSPDGQHIAFEAMTSALYSKTAAGSETEDLVLEAANLPAGAAGDEYRQLCGWAQNGRSLIYSQSDAAGKYGLWRLPLSGDRKPEALLHDGFNNMCGEVSPDSRWIAYASDEPGRNEIYVQAFSDKGALSGRKWQISYHGGVWPRWRRDGRELFFLDGERKLVAVEVRNAATFEHGVPQALFATGIMTPDSRFDVTADGRRFIIPTAVSSPAPATVVMNWMKAVRP